MNQPIPSSLGNRLKRYFYSPRNIAGCCLGMVGLGLLFTGVIGTGWPLIVGGLYAVGALAWPRSPDPEPEPEAEAEPEVSPDQLAEHLDNLVKKVANDLPETALAHLRSVQTTLDDLLPRLRALEESGKLSVESIFTVEETLRRYLPEMLRGYLNLPPAFAKQQPLKDGRTAAQTLTDQMQLLDESLKKIAQEAFAGDAEALVDSGRFLERKFNKRAVYEVN